MDDAGVQAVGCDAVRGEVGVEVTGEEEEGEFGMGVALPDSHHPC